MDIDFSDYQKPVDVKSDWTVSEEDYRAYPALNFHSLANFHRDPRAWKDGFFEQKEETDAMRFGTALHARILEGESVYEDKVGVFLPPINEKTGEPYGSGTKTFKEAYLEFLKDNAGKTIISREDSKIIEKLAESFFFHPTAARILGERDFRHTEMAVKGIWEVGGTNVEVKGRIDCYSDMGLVDVKTTSNLDDTSGRDRFRYAIYDFKYLVQLGFYHRLLTDCLGAPYVPCWIVAFERNEPHRIAVYKIDSEVIEKARNVAWKWIEDYVNAGKTDYYESRFDSIQLIDSYNDLKDL